MLVLLCCQVLHLLQCLLPLWALALLPQPVLHVPPRAVNPLHLHLRLHLRLRLRLRLRLHLPLQLQRCAQAPRSAGLLLLQPQPLLQLLRQRCLKKRRRWWRSAT